ncbi:hypothetical protein [Kytococcus sedentarius]|uniref:hypothetical protein n=1 Tax=Kytococcus sedentarius TaxID=1276 RepID=UPI0035BBD941
MSRQDLDPMGWVGPLGVGALAALLVLAAGALWLWRSRAAGRAREARARIEASRAALDAALMRRVLAAQEFVEVGRLDPSSSVIVLRTIGDVLDACDAAADEADLLGPDRLEAEEHLTEALRRAFHQRHGGGAGQDDAAGPQAQSAKRALAVASERVHTLRLRHNEVVQSTRPLLAGRAVRMLGLERGTTRPEVLQVEDDVPHLRPGGEGRPVD